MKKHQNAVDLFLEIVQIDSQSFEETPMVEFIADYAKKNYSCEIIVQELDMNDLAEEHKARLTAEQKVAKTKQIQLVFPTKDPSKDCIYLCAHIDTVSPGKGIKPQRDGNKITSDGTTVLGADDKSGVAPILAAMDEIVREGFNHGKIVLIFTALEEKGCLGARLLDIEKFGCKYGYVFDSQDSTGGMIERVQHVQSVDIEVTVSNIAGHAEGFMGHNALTVAAELMTKIPKGYWNDDDRAMTYFYSLKTENQPGFTVPYKAFIKGGIRSFSLSDVEMLRDQINKIVADYRMPDTEVVCKITPDKTLGYDHAVCPIGSAAILKTERILRGMGIEPVRNRHMLGGHDASIFRQKGIPSLVLSCGMRGFHTVNEYIFEEDLHNTTELIVGLIKAV